jgi:hypothetical protein
MYIYIYYTYIIFIYIYIYLLIYLFVYLFIYTSISNKHYCRWMRKSKTFCCHLRSLNFIVVFGLHIWVRWTPESNPERKGNHIEFCYLWFNIKCGLCFFHWKNMCGYVWAFLSDLSTPVVWPTGGASHGSGSQNCCSKLFGDSTWIRHGHELRMVEDIEVI